MRRHEVHRTGDPAATALELVATAMAEAVGERSVFRLCLSGGSTPLALYRALALRRDLPWEGVEFYWGDERFVPADHPDSNQRAAREALVDRVPVPASQVHAWPILETPEASAAAYARTLENRAGDPPAFDVTLLGLGADCHTASLFPGTDAHLATGATVVCRPPGQRTPRLSLTVPALSASRVVVFMVSGEEKRKALESLLAHTGDTVTCPARAVDAAERLLVITDLRAA